MSRYNRGTDNVVISLLANIQSKEGQYKHEIHNNHTFLKTAADRLVPESDNSLEHTLKTTVGGSITAEKVQEFVQEQRERLQALAADNVQDERTVDRFVAAVQQLREQTAQHASQQQQNQDDDDENFNLEDLDYEAKIRNLMETAAASSSQEDEMAALAAAPMYRDICNTLGLKIAAAAAAAAEEEDIEVVGGGGTAGGSRLRCPLTTAMLEEPVRSKVCKHVYSKRAVEEHIRRNHRCSCPVAGCTNHNLTLDQLEDDVEAQLLVRRETRRQEAVQQQRASQAEGLVDTDEEDEF